jgi:hypothetical protein
LELDHILAIHPVVRFMTDLLYKSEIDGRARLHYKDSCETSNKPIG